MARRPLAARIADAPSRRLRTLRSGTSFDTIGTLIIALRRDIPVQERKVSAEYRNPAELQLDSRDLGQSAILRHFLIECPLPVILGAQSESHCAFIPKK